MKKVRQEIKLKSQCDLADLIDNGIKRSFNITDDEYDFIAEYATDEDLSIFLMPNEPTFSDKRKALEIRNFYLEKFNQLQK